MKALLTFCFCVIPTLGFAEVIKLNCVMLHDIALSHSYTVDTQKKLVTTDAGPATDATITESVISFTQNNNNSGAVWSHLIHRHNGAMTIMDMKAPDKGTLKLKCDRVNRNKF